MGSAERGSATIVGVQGDVAAIGMDSRGQCHSEIRDEAQSDQGGAIQSPLRGSRGSGVAYAEGKTMDQTVNTGLFFPQSPHMLSVSTPSRQPLASVRPASMQGF